MTDRLQMPAQVLPVSATAPQPRDSGPAPRPESQGGPALRPEGRGGSGPARRPDGRSLRARLGAGIEAAPPARPPRETAELSEAEAFVLRGLRRWIVGLQQRDPRHWSMVWNDLAGAVGQDDARRLLTALTALVRGLCGHARRAIGHHMPCCSSISPDEACLLALIADCQRGDCAAAASRSAWLVQAAGSAELIAAAADMASVLAAHGYRLAARDHAPTPERVNLADLAAAAAE